MDNTTNRRTVDITNVSDRALEAALALRSGDNSVDWDALSSRELRDAARISGVNLSTWIYIAEAKEAANRNPRSFDFEGAILESQEDDGRNVG